MRGLAEFPVQQTDKSPREPSTRGRPAWPSYGLARARRTAALARSTGCGVDEAAAMLGEPRAPEVDPAGAGGHLSRRGFLKGLGAAGAAAALPRWLAAPARPVG